MKFKLKLLKALLCSSVMVGSAAIITPIVVSCANEDLPYDWHYYPRDDMERFFPLNTFRQFINKMYKEMESKGNLTLPTKHHMDEQIPRPGTKPSEENYLKPEDFPGLNYEDKRHVIFVLRETTLEVHIYFHGSFLYRGKKYHFTERYTAEWWFLTVNTSVEINSTHWCYIKGVKDPLRVSWPDYGRGFDFPISQVKKEFEKIWSKW